MEDGLGFRLGDGCLTELVKELGVPNERAIVRQWHDTCTNFFHCGRQRSLGKFHFIRVAFKEAFGDIVELGRYPNKCGWAE